MEKWLTVVDESERERLVKFRAELIKAIDANSAIWGLTTNEAERNERKRQNEYNRAKLKIVDSMLI